MSSTILIEGYCNVRIPDLLQLLPITGEGSQQKEKRYERIRTRAHKKYAVPRSVKVANAKVATLQLKRDRDASTDQHQCASSVSTANPNGIKRRKLVLFSERCRKHRRRGYLLAQQRSPGWHQNDKVAISRIKPYWLETHLWQSKRFHMSKLWGYMLPLMHNERSRRARMGARAHNRRRACNTRRVVAGCRTCTNRTVTTTVAAEAPAMRTTDNSFINFDATNSRSATAGVTTETAVSVTQTHSHTVSLSDISFIQPIEITVNTTSSSTATTNTDDDGLLALLSHFVDVKTHQIDQDNAPLMLGALEVECMCHRRDSFPRQSLGPVTLQFIAPSVTSSLVSVPLSVWIYAHPLFRDQLYQELCSCNIDNEYHCCIREYLARPPVRFSLRGGLSACRQVLKDVFVPSLSTGRDGSGSDDKLGSSNSNNNRDKDNNKDSNNDFYRDLLDCEGLMRVWPTDYLLPVTIQDCRKWTSRGLRTTAHTGSNTGRRIGKTRLSAHIESYKNRADPRNSTSSGIIISGNADVGNDRVSSQQQKQKRLLWPLEKRYGTYNSDYLRSPVFTSCASGTELPRTGDNVIYEQKARLNEIKFQLQGSYNSSNYNNNTSANTTPKAKPGEWHTPPVPVTLPPTEKKNDSDIAQRQGQRQVLSYDDHIPIIIIRKDLKSASSLLNFRTGINGGSPGQLADLDYSGFDIIIPGAYISSGSVDSVSDSKGSARGSGTLSNNIWQRLIMYSSSKTSLHTNTISSSCGSGSIGDSKSTSVSHHGLTKASKKRVKAFTGVKYEQTAVSCITTTMTNTTSHIRVKPIGLLETADMVHEVGALSYPSDYVECLATLRLLGVIDSSDGQELGDRHRGGQLKIGVVDSAVVKLNTERLIELLQGTDDGEDKEEEEEVGEPESIHSNVDGNDDDSDCSETASQSESQFEFVVMRRQEYINAYLPHLTDIPDPVDEDEDEEAVAAVSSAPVPSTYFPTVVGVTIRTVSRGVLLPGAELRFMTFESYKALLTKKQQKQSTGQTDSVDGDGDICGFVTCGKVSHTRGCCSVGLGYCSAPMLHKYLTQLHQWHHILTSVGNTVGNISTDTNGITSRWPRLVLVCKNPRAKAQQPVFFEVHSANV